MITAADADAVSTAMHESLGDLDDLDDNTRIKAALVILEVQEPDGTTRILCNVSPQISPAWTQGILLTAAQGITFRQDN